jgi:hypothetical protein
VGAELAASSAQSRTAENCGRPDPGHHPGGAHRARADADLDDVGAGLDEVADALGGHDVAGDERHPEVLGPDRPQRVEHPLLVAVGGVEHEHVDAGGEQLAGRRAASPLTPMAAAIRSRPVRVEAGR